MTDVRSPQEASATAEMASGHRRTLTLGGASAAPLAVLFGLNLVDEFDRVAFAAVISEIRDSFNLTDTKILALGAVVGIVQLLAALPLGVLADRFDRVKLAVVAAGLWGVCAVLTGIVPSLVLLYLVRMGTGIGRIINEVVHPSLLQDYYDAEDQPKVFGIHRAANSLGNLAGPIAGLVAAAYFWQAAFWILSIPTAIFIIVAVLKLREPVRGQSIDAEMAAAEAESGPIPIGEARRQLLAIPTLKRLYFGAFLLGVGILQVNNLLSLFFERVFEFGPQGRGFVQFVFGAGTIVGLLIGARLSSAAQRGGRVRSLATITGLSFVVVGLGFLLLAASPTAAVGVAMAFLLSVGNGCYQPAYFSLVGLVAPPRIRAQAYAYALCLVGVGGIAYLLIAPSDDGGAYRQTMLLLGLIVAVAGAVGASARKFVEKDADQAARSMAVAQQLRAELNDPNTERALLTCRGVEVAYGSVQILFGVDVEIREGEIVALLGTNGAGKSTLLKAISGLVDPFAGSIFLDGRDITHADAVQTAKMGVVQVPGGKAVFPTLTVAEHFTAGTWLFDKEDPAAVQARIDEVLRLFPRVKERWNQLAGNLSGGEQQQLALGMAFVAKPRLLIIDELSLGLAPTIVEQLLQIVRKIHEQGCTIILVEQSVNVALTVADRAYFMEKGEVRFEGPTADLLERGDILRSVFLEGAAQGPKGGAPVIEAPAPTVDKTSEPLLSVEDLSVSFGGIRAVSDVEFDLYAGQIVGLIGPNGAGKTTIFDLISGLLTPTKGRIMLQGKDITKWGPDRRAALGLGRSFQDAKIFPSLTVAENIAIGLERHLEVRDHVSALLALPAMQESEEDVAWTVNDLIELMGLGAFRDKFVSELSTGSRRIVDLAMSIAHDPDVLLLDEPSSGVAQKETEALGPLLKRIQRETGCAMLLIEHDMPLITSVSDEIIALELGSVVLQDRPEVVIADPRVISAYLGGDISVINRSGASGNGHHGDDDTPPSPANGANPAPRKKRVARAAR